MPTGHRMTKAPGRPARFLVALLASMAVAPAWAQAPVAPSGRAAVEAELRELNAMQSELERRIRALEAKLGSAAPPPAAAVAAAAPPPAASPPPAPVATASADDRPSVELYGHAMFDFIQDFDRVNPDWEGTFRPSRIPTTPGQFGSAGQTTLSVRQSRLGIQGRSLVSDTPAAFRIEFDFFGVGPDAGQTTIRLRHAYAEWGPLLAGQTFTLFQDGDVFPKIIDYWGPAGIISIRNPQLRWTFVDRDGWKAAVALERPSEVIDTGEIRLIDPDLATNLRSNEEFPDLTAQLRYKGANGHVQLAGVARKIGWDTVGTPDGEPEGSVFGWGLNLSGSARLGMATFRGGIVYGHGIGNYMNDGGVDLAPSAALQPGPVPPIAGVTPPPNLLVEAKALPLLGVSAYVDLAWSKRWSSSIGYSRTDADNTNFQSGSAIDSGEYASANLLFAPAPNILTGGEFLWGRRRDFDGDSGTATRFQYSFKYLFNTGNILKK